MVHWSCLDWWLKSCSLAFHFPVACTEQRTRWACPLCKLNQKDLTVQGTPCNQKMSHSLVTPGWVLPEVFVASSASLTREWRKEMLVDLLAFRDTYLPFMSFLLRSPRSSGTQTENIPFRLFLHKPSCTVYLQDGQLAEVAVRQPVMDRDSVITVDSFIRTALKNDFKSCLWRQLCQSTQNRFLRLLWAIVNFNLICWLVISGSFEEQPDLSRIPISFERIPFGVS